MKSVSMRGRFAYALLCVESALREVDGLLPKWQHVLDRFWRYVSEESLDEWHEELAEWTPDVILGTETYVSGDFDFLSASEFLSLKKLYVEAGPRICEMLDLAFDIGSEDLFGSVHPHKSLLLLNELVTLTKAASGGAPPSALVAFSSINEADGWGYAFSLDRLRHPEKKTPRS